MVALSGLPVALRLHHAGKKVIAATISVEAIGLTFDVEATPHAGKPFLCAARHGRRLHGRRAVMLRSTAGIDPAGGTVDGPALITEATATTIVEPGWQAEMTAIGNLVLRRVVREERMAIGTTIRSCSRCSTTRRLPSRYTLQNTALSVNEGTSGFSCAIRSTGSLIANAPHMPVHLGSMGEWSARSSATMRAR